MQGKIADLQNKQGFQLERQVWESLFFANSFLLLKWSNSCFSFPGKSGSVEDDEKTPPPPSLLLPSGETRKERKGNLTEDFSFLLLFSKEKEEDEQRRNSGVSLFIFSACGSQKDGKRRVACTNTSIKETNKTLFYFPAFQKNLSNTW